MNEDTDMTPDERVAHFTEHGWCPTPWDHHPAPVVDLIRKTNFRPGLKECFANCQRLLVENRTHGNKLDLEYHEGLAFSIIPFHHAWLVYEGETLELTIPPDHIETHYLKGQTYEYVDIVQNMMDTGCYTALMDPKEFARTQMKWKELLTRIES